MSGKTKKATFNFHPDVLAALDEAMAEGVAPSKNALVERALVRELKELRRRARQARWEEGAKDPVLLRDQIEKAYAVGNVATSREFIEFWLAKANKEETRTRCLAPNVEILVFATGDVYPCGNIQKPVGNLREDSLEKIYENYRGRRKEIRAGEYPPCDECIYPDIIFARGFWQNTERLFKKVLP